MRQGAEQRRDRLLVSMEYLVIFMRIPRDRLTGKSNKVGFPMVKSDGGLHYFY